MSSDYYGWHACSFTLSGVMCTAANSAIVAFYFWVGTTPGLFASHSGARDGCLRKSVVIHLEIDTKQFSFITVFCVYDFLWC